MYRTKATDPDYRRQPKTQCYCELCQRDVDPTKARWIAYELDNPFAAIHPDDVAAAWPAIRARRSAHHHNECIVFGRIGPECARRLGREWTMDEATMLQHRPEAASWKL